MRSIATRSTNTKDGGARHHGIVLALSAVLLGVLALAATAGCGSQEPVAPAASPSAAAAAAPEMAEVTLIMDWVPWVLDIPIDVAQEKSYYTDAGLTVKQILPAGATDVVKFVSTGKAQFGLYYAPDMLMGVAEGAPLLSVGSLMSQAPVGLAMAPGLQASEPKDLVGKVVAVPMIPSTRASYETLLEAGGVQSDQVKLADPGFNLVAPLLKGTYQAVAFTEFAELVEAEAGGQDIAYMDFRDWGTPDYAFLNMVTSNEFAKANPNTTRAFTTATLAGLAYAVAHPEEAVDIYVARHPELKKELLLAQWNAAIPSMAVAGEQLAGYQDPVAWGELNDWLVQTGLIDEAVDVSSATSNEFLPAE
jgi:ABC-type nitrate/sulfonate/bicarbonate transport system substrate-binding protein